MAKTIINLSDPVSTLVSKTNTISSHLGDISQLNVGASNDSDIVQAINYINSNNTDSATISALIDSAYVQARETGITLSGVVSVFQKDSANGIGLDSSEGRFFVPPNTINTSMIENSAITADKLAGDAVTSAKIADDQINSQHYVDGSIDTAHIADAQITLEKIADSAIDSDRLTTDAVSTIKIQDDAVTSAKIADDTVAEANMADDAIGSAQLKSLSTLQIKNSSGTVLKTIHGAGA